MLISKTKLVVILYFLRYNLYGRYVVVYGGEREGRREREGTRERGGEEKGERKEALIV